MAAYLVDVRPFLDDVGGGVHLNDSIDLDTIVFGDVTFRSSAPVLFDVDISNAGEAFVAVGTVRAPVVTACSRCLCEFALEISGDVEGYWPRPGHEVPDETDITGQIDAEGRIDIAPALLAALLVEAPFAPIHDEGCKGLCPSCGADLNAGTCGCEAQPANENPFSALKDLLPPEEPADE